jgi:hypothetical protein
MPNVRQTAALVVAAVERRHYHKLRGIDRDRASTLPATALSRGEIAKHQRVVEATVIASTPPDHGDICLAECVIAHQLTLISRWIEQRGDLGFGLVAPSSGRSRTR